MTYAEFKLTLKMLGWVKAKTKATTPIIKLIKARQPYTIKIIPDSNFVTVTWIYPNGKHSATGFRDNYLDVIKFVEHEHYVGLQRLRDSHPST